MSLLEPETAGQHINRVSVNAAKQAGVDTSRIYTGGANLTKYDIPLDHLDFRYIESCKDVKELEKIYRILKSGSEGNYPDLEKKCEERIKELSPNSRILRKDKPAKTTKDLQQSEAKAIEEEIENWSSEMKSMDGIYRAKNEKISEENLPPIRGSGATNSIPISSNSSSTENAKNKTNKRVKPRDYKEWDKFDIDGELEKVDKERETKPSYSKPKKLQHVDETISSKGMTPQEIERKAEMEKNKGNEYFASQEYDAAILYYSRSLSLIPSAASYNNRALAYLKLEKWANVVSDCNRVLQMENTNIKAFLRRGTAYKEQKNYADAVKDFQGVLKIEPHNERAKKLLDEGQKLLQEQEEEQKTKGRRLVIEDVEGSDEEVEEIEAEPAPEAGKKGRKMVIEEVENSDSESEASVPPGGEEETKMVNGNVTQSNTSVTAGCSAATETKDSQVAMETKETNTGNMPKRTNPFDKVSSENQDWALTDMNTGASSINAAEGAPPSEEEHLEPKEAQVVVRPEQTVVAGPKIIEPVDLPADVQVLKSEGNDLFRAGQYSEAINKYSKALHKLHKADHHFYNTSLLLSNRAACKSKIGDARGCVEDCDESLRLVPHSIKPLIRRAQAYETLEKYRKAYVDYRHVLAVDSSVDIAHQGSTRCGKALFDLDGSKWREKITKIPSVNPEELFVVASPSDVVSTPTTPEEVKPAPAAAEPVKPEKTPEERFLEIKDQGAAFVKKQDFKNAVEAYSSCIELFPERAVSYTNRALCYLRIDKAVEALNDCSKALELEPENVKAYFRRAQAKKMLKYYKGSMEDLLNLLKIDNKNTAARKELDVVQKYYREELIHQKAEQTASSKPATNGENAGKKKDGGKQRKKLVIEEVEVSSDEEKDKKKSAQKSSPRQAANKNKQESKRAPPSEGKSNKKERRKGGRTVTAPTLVKKTPYEFIQAWNSLKKGQDIEQYAKLIEQINPADLPKLISNKLEGDMLTVLIKCIHEHFLEKDLSFTYDLLLHLQKVDRFKLLTMFVAPHDKVMLDDIFEKLQSGIGTNLSHVSKKDVEILKDNYGV